MNILNLFRVSFKAIMNNKFRAFLTMLGIIIGVGAVITMIAVGQGSKRSIADQIAEMGSNIIMISPSVERRGGSMMDASSMQSLKLANYQALKEECVYLSYVSPYVSAGGQLVAGNNNYPSSITGVAPEYLDIRQLTIADGVMFTDSDVNTNAKVCVIGQTIIDNLFPDGSDPIGKTIRFGQVPMMVVGVLESKGNNAMGMDQDDIVLAPYTIVMKRMLSVNYLSMIYASALDEDLTDEAVAEITDILRREHKLRATDDDDFDINNTQEISDTINSAMNTMTLLLACIAAISLIVGGIGIMNIMYVSVTERTKEIGLRMAVGARGQDILGQFLIEAVVISITGGILGVIFGCAISAAIRFLANFPVYIMAWSIFLSFGVCTLTGVFFGWYPAKKASDLDPIDALRYE